MSKNKRVKPNLTKDGAYRVRWTENGQRRSKFFRTKVLASNFCRDLNSGDYQENNNQEDEQRTKLSNGSDVIVKTFGDLVKVYLDFHIEAKCSSSTRRNYKMYLKNHILPFFGPYRLAGLRLRDMDFFISRLKKTRRQKGQRDRSVLVVDKTAQSEKVFLSEKMQRELVCLVLSITRYGYERDYLEKDPFKLFKLPKLKDKKREYFTPDEVKKFLEWCDSGGVYVDESGVTRLTTNIQRDAEIFRFALHTGARLGEILGLKRKAIDFSNRRIWISEIYDMSAKEYAARTKGGNIRCIEMDDVCQEILRKRENNSPESLVFEGVGRPAWMDSFYVYCNRAGVKAISFHALRHTFATTMALHTPTPVLQKLLGHESINTTMKYVHIANGDSAGYTASLSSMYQGRPKTKLRSVN